MQLTNTPQEKQFPAIEKFLQAERLARYMPAADKVKDHAFKLYLWNCALCEAFFLPLHFAEVGCRNAIHSVLQLRIGPRWYENQTFRGLLDPRFRDELDRAVGDERKQHGTQMTAHHIVSALTFGFWEHLTIKRFDRLLWIHGIRSAFPGAQRSHSRIDLHGMMEKVRRWRNRIAHHRAIFDKGPSRKIQEVMDLLTWTCPETAAWVGSVSRINATINERPTF